MYTIYSKDRKSLQFPVMCDGYVTIPWGDGVNSPAQNVGLWGHSGGITVEFIITPYDIFNSSVTSTTSSQKSLPQSTKGLAYLTASNRRNVHMVLLRNSHMEVTLESTSASSSPNKPAAYSITFKLTTGTTSTTLTTDNSIYTGAVITPEIADRSSSDPTQYLYSSHLPFAVSSVKRINTLSSNTLNMASATTTFIVGENIYTNTGGLIGRILSLGSNTITVDAITNTPTNQTFIYTELPKEPTYVDVPHHIAVSYSPSGDMVIFYNGNEVKRGSHTVGGNFSFHPSNIYLGQNPDGSYGAIRKSQFMGEYHELSITGGYRKTFRSMNSLLPTFKNTLLYMDFEEANLDG